MDKLLYVSSSPHIKAYHSTRSIMRDVIIALVPALIAGVYFYGLRALLLTLISIIACVGFEWLWEKVFRKTVTVGDLSAVVTGILLAFNVPVTLPFFMIIIGAFIAIILIKQLFGGLGQNFINPALGGRAFLLAAYGQNMRSFTVPIPGEFTWRIDAVTAATPLELIKNHTFEKLPSLLDAFLGNIGGCIGETSAFALLLGASYLLYKRVIRWQIPVCYIGSVFIVTLLFGGEGLYRSSYSLLLGGVILGAFFMATDYTTTPMTVTGQIIFAIGAGVITAVIRLFGGYPEGVSYSILIMNLVVPLIDRYIGKRPFGGGIE